LANECQISKKEADAVVYLFFNEMANALTKGDRVEIRGLCSFYAREHAGYTDRNPKTGETVNVSPKKGPYFKCGKGLRSGWISISNLEYLAVMGCNDFMQIYLAWQRKR